MLLLLLSLRSILLAGRTLPGRNPASGGTLPGRSTDSGGTLPGRSPDSAGKIEREAGSFGVVDGGTDDKDGCWYPLAGGRVDGVDVRGAWLDAADGDVSESADCGVRFGGGEPVCVAEAS